MKFNLKEIAQNKKAQKITAIVCGSIIGISSILGVAGFGVALASKNDPLAPDVAREKMVKSMSSFTSKYNEEKFGDITLTQTRHFVNADGDNVHYTDTKYVNSINNDGDGLYTISMNYESVSTNANGEKMEVRGSYTLGHYVWAGETETKYYVVSESTYDGETTKNAALLDEGTYKHWVELWQEGVVESIWTNGFVCEELMFYNPVYRQSVNKMTFNAGYIVCDFGGTMTIDMYGKMVKGVPTYTYSVTREGASSFEFETYINYSSNAKLADMATIDCVIEGSSVGNYYCGEMNDYRIQTVLPAGL